MTLPHINKQTTTLLILIVLGIATVTLFDYCSPKSSKEDAIAKEPNEFVGNEACKSCHQGEYNLWKQSDHFKAMQLPNDSTVEGNFNGATFHADGVTSSFSKRDGKYIINTEGADGKNHDYEVKYTFGYFPLQQYLIETDVGKLQATRLSWDARQKKWFHQYAGKKIPAGDWLHWTGNAQNWNTMCAECHSTNLQKKYDINSDTYHTTFNEINVSCESCHGAGKHHITYIQSDAYKQGNKVAHSYLDISSSSSALEHVQTCAPCHSVKTNISANKINSGEFLDNYIPAIPTTERFYADGQMRDEDYNYTNFLESKMFAHNVSCNNCHNPHSGKLYLTGNQVCLQCHAPSYNTPAHTFHAETTTGSTCVGCHMPASTYMGNDIRHDHSFRVPRPDLSVKYGTPNACNNCHKDKTATWAASAVDKWYGSKRKYHFAEDLIAGSLLNEGSEGHLLKLLSDTSVPAIIHATAANYLGNIGTGNSTNGLLACLKDANAQVRYEALRSLQNHPAERWLQQALPLLNDKVRAVRIAAASLVQTIPDADVPQEYKAQLAQAKGELENHLLYQADFAHGNILIGDYYHTNNNLPEAERFYKRALQKDSLASLARLSLATVYSAEHKNEEAMAALQLVVRIDDKNDDAWHSIGLLYVEMKQEALAKAAFEKAVSLHSHNTRLYYNYGLLLQQEGNIAKSVSILQKGLALQPNDESLLYAIIFTYANNKQTQAAEGYAKRLYGLDPDNGQYQQIYQVFHLR